MNYDPRMVITNSIFTSECQKGSTLDLAVVFITTEGIQHISGGVARYIWNFIETLAKLIKPLTKYGINITLYGAEPGLLRVVPTYNRKDFKNRKKLFESTGGAFFKLVNNTYGEDWIHHVENWKIMSASAATIALNIAEKHQATLVFFGSSCLALTQVYIHKQLKAFDADVRTVYLTHDSAFSSFWEERNENVLAMDYLCTQWSKFTPNAKIGHVSDFMQHLFMEKFMVSEEEMVPARGGVFFDEERFKYISQETAREILIKNHIPIDRKLIFSWGRPTRYKRFDLVFRVAQDIPELYPVVVTNGVFDDLRNYLNQLSIEGKLIENYKGFELIQALLQWSNTLAVCLFSEDEPGSIVPMEAMYLARHTGPVVLANRSGIYLELIKDGVNGFLVENKPEKITEKLLHISKLGFDKNQEIRERGYTTVVTQYDQKINYLKTMAACVPHIAQQYAQLLTELKKLSHTE